MDTPETRLHCLKIAMELGGKHEAVLSSAEQLLSFIVGPKAAIAAMPVVTDAVVTEAVAAAASPADLTEAALEVTGPEVTGPVDAIAFCGTALAMPDGGDLAEAVPVNEALATQPEAVLEMETPSERHVTLAASEAETPTLASTSDEALSSPSAQTESAPIEIVEVTNPDPASDTPKAAAHSAEIADTAANEDAKPAVEVTNEANVSEPEPAAHAASTQTPSVAPHSDLPHPVSVVTHEEPGTVHH